MTTARIRGGRRQAAEEALPEVQVPEELARELARQRELADARRADELARARAEAGHGRARADVAEETRLAELARAEREADVQADAELARMFREFRANGARTRVRADMARSGEARALRLEWLRRLNLRVLVPVLVGFGIWSTTGVQQGAARLMAAASGSPVWWALWGLEALLIGAVCWIIIARARLSASGGKLAASAERIGVGCLTTSVFLNLIAAVPVGDGPHPSGWAVPGAMFAHALGPVGAAVTAHLIGLVDRSIGEADPWHEGKGENKVAVPRLAEMDLSVPAASVPASVPAFAAASQDEDAPETASEVRAAVVWPVLRGDRTGLPVVARPQPVGPVESLGRGVSRTRADRDGERPRQGGAEASADPSANHREVRPNRGVRVPPTARRRASANRSRSDEELSARLAELVESGELEPVSVRAVERALGVGRDRAKRVLELAGLGENPVPGPAVESGDQGDRPLTVLAGGVR
ncbi:hypothetical protein ACFOY4_15925 [Actinomadura syzygii]|uniref:DUF2637 domain-containing protein n=1 Tax=Actinomadura syzygii TaxID=1427538 RepID=A0A5D0U0G8_9ACTN|nr:hypothetical protein [Actinomadura syzygii]TYC11554.1 hypothetical protein FXF65_25960 [Actinomadura syzygii]